MKLQLIDFKRKGNLIALYYGNPDKATGDDWDDAPYEHNKGQVYKKYIEYTEVHAIPIRIDVVEPSDFFTNSPYCWNDFKTNGVPILIFVPEDDFLSSLGDYVDYPYLCLGMTPEEVEEVPNAGLRWQE